MLHARAAAPHSLCAVACLARVLLSGVWAAILVIVVGVGATLHWHEKDVGLRVALAQHEERCVHVLPGGGSACYVAHGCVCLGPGFQHSRSSMGPWLRVPRAAEPPARGEGVHGLAAAVDRQRGWQRCVEGACHAAVCVVQR